MFDDQAHEYQHEFSRTSSLIFPLHASSPPPAAAAADFHHPYSSSSHDQIHILQPAKKGEDDHSALEYQRSSWSDNELLALLKIRSSVDNWFPDLIWEHVSRKLGDLGFKRSAERCKQKFEEETTFNTSFNKKSDARFFALEDFFHNDHHPSNVHDHETNAASEKVMKTSSQDNQETSDSKRMMRKKRKRSKLETLRCFCIDMVNKMMGQQEALHNKLLQEMIVRDEQKIAAQEALKKNEMERLNNEIEIRARRQAFDVDRQAGIIDFLNKFTSNDYTIENQLCLSQFEDLFKLRNKDELVTSSLSETAEPRNPASVTLNTLPLQSRTKVEKNSSKAAKDVEDIGKRWPKDEVLALINIRSSLGNTNDQEKEKEGGAKGSLWEKISNGMSELGYKRSAKRCKEKWENINKYFRKTKDSNKKRSIESRTCPYFHQLSSLYNIPGTTTSVSETNQASAMSESHRLAMPEKKDAGVGVVDEENANATYSTSHFQL